MSEPRNEFLQQLAAERQQKNRARQVAGSGRTSRAPSPREAGSLLPLTAAQMPIWLQQATEPHSTAFNCPLSLRIGGPLDSQALHQALVTLTARHEMLRARVTTRQGTPHLAVEESCATDFAIDYLEGAEHNDAELTGKVTQEHNRPFRLHRAPLLRVRLFVLGAHDYVLAITVHHLISDARTMRLVLEELVALYEAHCAGESASLPEKTLDFGDYCAWDAQNPRPIADRLEALCARYAGTEAIDMPCSGPRTTLGPSTGRKQFFTLDTPCKDTIEAFCAAAGLTPFVFHLSVLSVLLARYTGQRGFFVAVPSSLRPHHEAENIVGCFLNTLLFAASVDERDSFHDAASKVKAGVAELLETSDLPFNELASALKNRLGIPTDELLGLMFNFNDVSDAHYVTQSGLTLTPYTEHQFEARTDFAVTVSHKPTDVGVSVEYDSARFSADFIEAFGQAYCRFARHFAADPAQPVGRAALLSRQQVQQQLEDWQGAPSSHKPLPIGELFERQLAKCKDAIAFYDGSGNTLSFGQLDSVCKTLAGTLSASGVAPGHVVGLYLERSIEFAAAAVTLMRLGAVFFPVDTAESDERARATFTQAGVRVVLAIDADKLQMLRKWGFAPVRATAEPPCELPVTRGQNGVSPASMLYCIQTSGSTGKGKAVLSMQTGIVNRLQWMWQTYPFADGEACCCKTSVGFVDVVCELLSGLLQGIPTRIVSREELLDTPRFVELLINENITRLTAVPALLASIASTLQAQRRRLSGLRVCVSSGAPISGELKNALLACFDQCRLLNLYGSAETSADASCAELVSDDDQVTAGRPIDGVKAYVLDADLRLLPAGCVGELYVGGAALAAGYRNAAGLSAERFIPDPFCENGGRLFRTGDVARFNSDGAIVIIGRRDAVVKIRGQRVDPGEVEAVLLKLPQVEAAVVTKAPDSAGLAMYLQLRKASEYRAAQRAMQFGIFFFGDHDGKDEDYELFRRSTVAADELELSSVWVPERHFHSVAGLYSNPTVLAAWAACATTRLDIRAGSVVLPLNNPIRVAEAWATIDRLSHGRAGVSFTSGWVPRDFALAPENYATRREVLKQGVRTIEQLWAGGAITARDGAGNDAKIQAFPQPADGRLPVWITCSGDPAMFAWAGEHGYNILTALLQQSVAELAEKLNIYHQSLRQHGHSVADKTVTLMLHTLVGDDHETAVHRTRPALQSYLRSHIELAKNLIDSNVVSIDEELKHHEDDIARFAVERYIQGSSLIGDVDSCAAMAQRVAAVGVTEIACLIDFGVDKEVAIDGLSGIARLMHRCRDDQHHDTRLDIRSHLERLLPQYMIPSEVSFVDELPQLASGKIDLVGLRAGHPPGPLLTTRYAEPETDTEKALAEIWRTLLHSKRVGRHDSFFELGGHSLNAVQIINRIQQEFCIRFDVGWIFSEPALKEMAAKIDRQVDEAVALIESIEADEPD